MLGEGEGGTGDRLIDAQSLSHALNQGGFAGSKLTPQQQDRSRRESSSQLSAKAAGGLGIH